MQMQVQIISQCSPKARQILAALTLTAVVAACGPSPNEPRVDSRRLAQANAILDDTLRTELILAPDEASRRGLIRLARPDDKGRLSDVSQAGFERARLIRLDLLDQLGKRPVLPADHPIARDLWVTTDAYIRLSRVQANGHGRLTLGQASPYAIDPYGGMWVEGPDLLSNVHRIGNLADAEAYVRRLTALSDAIGDIKRRMIADAATGITPPVPVLARLKRRISELLSEDSNTLKSLTTDLENLMLGVPEISPTQRRALLMDATRIVEQNLYPAYADLLETLDRLETRAPGQLGLWALASDTDLYASYMTWRTGQGDLALSELHAASLDEVESRQAALRQAFAELWRQSQPETDTSEPPVPPEMTLATLSDLFAQRPEDAPWPATPVAVTRQQSLAETDVSLTGQQLSMRAVDRSRPDILVTNSEQLASWPAWLAALFDTSDFHRAALRMADATSLAADRTPVRALIHVPVLDEGWTSLQQSQYGMITPDALDWQDIAWHHWLLVEAVLAAADTGLHVERWTLEATRDFVMQEALLPEDLAEDALIFLAVNPGHYASRRFGGRHLDALRTRSEAILADRFDASAFENAVLQGGSRPLYMVDEDVESWYESQLSPSE